MALERVAIKLLVGRNSFGLQPLVDPAPEQTDMNSTYFGLLAEFGEANIPLARVAPKYFGLSFAEARRRAPAKQLPCRVFRLGGQKSPWLISASYLAELIDKQRERANVESSRSSNLPSPNHKRPGFEVELE